jgi:hypothetical protein
MSLESFLEPDAASIKSKIRQRRAQMLCHSYIYYVLDDNIVSDDKWQQWANELREIQEKYPKYCKIDFFDKYFYTWTGDTGMHLPLKDPWVVYKATQIYNYEKGEK